MVPFFIDGPLPFLVSGQDNIQRLDPDSAFI